MKLALRWKITLAFTLVSALILGLLYVYLHAAVRESGTRRLTASLLTEARLISDHLPALSPLAPDLQQWAQALDTRIDARVTIIGGDLQ